MDLCVRSSVITHVSRDIAVKSENVVLLTKGQTSKICLVPDSYCGIVEPFSNQEQFFKCNRNLFISSRISKGPGLI